MVGTRRNEGPSIAAEPPRMCYCGRPVYNDGACVCHSMDDDKDPTAFSLELARVREAGVRGRGYDFSQFVFPRSGWSLPDSYQGPANFFNATFLGDVDMSRTRFSEGADFSSAHFLGRTNFYACLFGAPTKFVKTRFDALVSFEEAKFQDDVAFLGSNFSLEVIFARVNFAGSATFDLAHFGGQSDFSFARFLGATSFEGTSYSARVTFLRAVFQRPLETTFSTTDLANVSLLECDVSQVRFFNVKWNREKKWYEASRDRVYDALHSRNYAGVAEVY